MRVIALSDLHGSIEMVEQILFSERYFDLVILAGDITTAGTPPQLEKAIRRVEAFGKPVLAVAGNMDSLALERKLEQLGVSIDSRGVTIGEVGFFGVSAAPASPLRPDIVRAVNRITDTMFPGVPVVPNQSSGATDGRYLRAAGIPTYGVQGFPTDRDDYRAHGKDERMLVKSLP